MKYIKTCKWDKTEIDMYGEHPKGCVHPNRYKFELRYNFFFRFLRRLFGLNKLCDASPCYERLCPYYENERISPPKINGLTPQRKE